MSFIILDRVALMIYDFKAPSVWYEEQSQLGSTVT